MTETGVAIKYGDFAPGAKEAFDVDVNDKADFVNIDQLKQYNLQFQNYENPCEDYSVILDGGAVAFPSSPAGKNIGLWSESRTDESGNFSVPIELELTSTGQFSSQGFTFTFDTYAQVYPRSMSIQWYRDTGAEMSLLHEETFTPDNAFYFCHAKVDNFNRVVIKIESLNMPNASLKIRSIDYGYGTVFYGDELRSVRCIQEINPISTEISINTVDFTLDSKSDIEYSFQTRQPLSVYFNDTLIATMFVKSAKRKARFLWDVQAEDYISLLEDIPFKGGIYYNKQPANLFREILDTANVPYHIGGISSETLYGWIPYTNCREALMQVAFATQSVVDTSYSDAIEIYPLKTNINQHIPLERIMQGQSFNDDTITTRVEITSHNYYQGDKENGEFLYKASESGAGNNICVIFSEPMWGLETRGTCEILESGENYAIINAGEDGAIGGYKYKHETKLHYRENPVVLENATEKVVSIDTGATLIDARTREVGRKTVDKVLDACYNWLVKTTEVNLDIIEGVYDLGNKYVQYGQMQYGTFQYGGKSPKQIEYDLPVRVGDNITADTEYLGTVTGRVIKQTFNLSGNQIIKSTVIK